MKPKFEDDESDRHNHHHDDSIINPAELYDFELIEKENPERHGKDVEHIKKMVIEQERAQKEKGGSHGNNSGNRDKNQSDNLVKAAPSQSEDILVQIRNDDMIKRIAKRNANECLFDNLLSGCTATLVIQTSKKLFLGWIGDSNALIWGNGKEKSKNSAATNFLHRPEETKETYRIYDNRGEVRQTEDGIHRIFLRARMYPGLKISRTFGDLIPH